MKPRFTSDRDALRAFVADVARSDVDYIIDDELTVDCRRLPFRERAELVLEELAAHAPAGRTPPRYIANVAGGNQEALARAFTAKELGAAGVMVNGYTMGQELTQELAMDDSFGLGIVSNGLGIGVLGNGPPYGVATEVVARLCRLCGADAVYTGPLFGLLDSLPQSVGRLKFALTEPYGKHCVRPAAAAVMSGGMGLSELLRNSQLYEGPLLVSLGYQFAEARLAGVPGPVVIECIRAVWSAVIEDGIAGGQLAVRTLDRKSKAHSECIRRLGAEAAVSRSAEAT